jgi:hypothetical protein
MLTAKVEKNELVIRIPMNSKPFPASASAKTAVVASSHGNVTTDLIIDGKPLVIGVNAYLSNR